MANVLQFVAAGVLSVALANEPATRAGRVLISEAAYYCSGAPDFSFSPDRSAVPLLEVPIESGTEFSILVPGNIVEMEQRLQQCINTYVEEPGFRELIRDHPAYRSRVHEWLRTGR